MKYLQKFESFSGAEPAVKPAEPRTTPKTDPNTKPSRPSPIRRDAPSVEPDPKAKAKAKSTKLRKSTSEAIANRFIKLSDEKSIDMKKYIKR